MAFTLKINNKSCSTAYAFVSVISGSKVVDTKQPAATAGIATRTTGGAAITSLILTGNKEQTISGLQATKDDVVVVNIVAANDPTSAAVIKAASKTLKDGDTSWTITVGGIANYGLYVTSAVFVVIFFVLLLVVFILLVRAAMKDSA